MLDLLAQPARMVFCEEPVAGAIRHPADTWTNIGPVLAGVWVMLTAQCPTVRFLGASAVWMGAMSFVFHATGSLGGEALDLHGMYLFLMAILCLQHSSFSHRVQWLDAAVFSVFVATVIMFGFLYLPWLGTPAFAVFLGLVIIRQFMRGFSRQWYWMLGTFAVAYAFWLLDYHRILCRPCNHFLTGHGIWHLLNGVIVLQAAKIFDRPKTWGYYVR